MDSRGKRTVRPPPAVLAPLSIDEQKRQVKEAFQKVFQDFIAKQGVATIGEATLKDPKGYREIVRALTLELAEINAASAMQEVEAALSSDSELSDYVGSQSEDEEDFAAVSSESDAASDVSEVPDEDSFEDFAESGDDASVVDLDASMESDG